MEQMPELHGEAAELSLLAWVASTANAAFKAEELLTTVSARLKSVLQWERVVCGLLQPDDKALSIVLDTSSQEAPVQPVSSPSSAPQNDLEKHVSGFSLLLETFTANPITTLQVANPDLEGTRERELLEEEGLQTVLLVSLYSKEQKLGVIALGSSTPRNLPPAEMHLLAQIGEMVSTTIARIHRYEDIEQAERLKSAFLARVTHELRTPVTSIIGYLQMLDRGKYGDIPQSFEEPFKYMLHSSNRMQSLVNDLLDFSKMEAGHLQIELAEVDVAPIIHNVAGIVHPQLQERGLGICVEVASNLPPVKGNSDRLEQVLTNLVSNAIKFTDEGTITVQAEHRGETVRLSVQDQGIGIPPEHQALIFGEYQQIKNQHTLRFAGTGLGLAISRGLVELMGGTMWLSSEFGIGSTFYCDLPAASNHLE